MIISELKFSKEEYESISAKRKLPLRCPLIYTCERAKGTRLLFSQEQGGDGLRDSFTYHLTEDENYQRNPTLHTINRHKYPKEYLLYAWDVCPEEIFVRYKYFASDYEFYKSYDMEGKIKSQKEIATGKHYSECYEFSMWSFSNNKDISKKKTPRGIKSRISPKERFAVFQRDGFRCQYCGATKNSKELEVDHKIPVSQGGTDEFNNLVTACIDCNRGKSDKII